MMSLRQWNLVSLRNETAVASSRAEPSLSLSEEVVTMPAAPTSVRPSNRRISVVMPLYNEAGVLERLYRDTRRVLQDSGREFELLFVNDGSTDGSTEILESLADRDSDVKVLHLSRNFGHQAAVHAGLTRANGDAVIVMDTDLQDDPCRLPDFIRCWEYGFDVVYAVRTKRKEGPFKRAMFYLFYRLLNLFSTVPIPNDAGNFGLIDRRVVDVLARLDEYDRYYPGLRRWVGFRQTGIRVERGRRHDRQPRVSYLGLFRLAKTALFSLSSAPLGLVYLVALVSVLVCAVSTCFALYHKLVTGLDVGSWTITVTVASFFGALNALGIGVWENTPYGSMNRSEAVLSS